MTADLRQTKAARNDLTNENSYVILIYDLQYHLIGFRKLKRRLAEAELQRDESVIS